MSLLHSQRLSPSCRQPRIVTIVICNSGGGGRQSALDTLLHYSCACCGYDMQTYSQHMRSVLCDRLCGYAMLDAWPCWHRCRCSHRCCCCCLWRCCVDWLTWASPTQLTSLYYTL